MPLPFQKSFDTIYNELLTDYENQGGKATLLSQIRFSCSASAIWSIYKVVGWVYKQALPHKSEGEALKEWASGTYGLTISPTDTEDEIRAALQKRVQEPPAGGNKKDFEEWAKGFVNNWTKENIQFSDIECDGFFTYNASKLVNGILGTEDGWNVSGSDPGAYITFDLGSAKEIVAILVYANAAGHQGIYNVQYSDNNSDWTNVSSLFSPIDAGWNKVEWSTAGLHRYWKIELTNGPGSDVSISEVEFYSIGQEKVVDARFYPDDQIAKAGTAKIAILSDRTSELASAGLMIKCKEYIDSKRPGSPRFVQITTPTKIYPYIGYRLHGFTTDQYQQFLDEMEALIKSKRIGEPFYVAEGISLGREVGIENVQEIEPTVDVFPTYDQIIRWNGIALGVF
jgi:hypothetical protein